jgi:hypothetical protein
MSTLISLLGLIGILVFFMFIVSAAAAVFMGLLALPGYLMRKFRRRNF